MKTNAPLPAADETPPDWAAAGTPALACPTCGYDLHSLTTPRCPECGGAFRWADLLAAKRDRHPWLFEHARRRRVRAFLQTYARTGLPWHFWRQVTPDNPVRVGRLVLYWLLVSLPLASVAGGTSLGIVVGIAQVDLARRHQLTDALRHPTSRPNYYATPAAIDAEYPVPWSFAFARKATVALAQEMTAPRVAAAAVPVAWPWLTAAALLAFRSPLRRAGRTPADVLRAAVYGCDFGLLAIAVAGTYYSLRYDGRLDDLLNDAFHSAAFGRDAPLLILMVLTSAALASVRVSVAAALYLRLRRPVPTVLAAQVIAVVAAVLVLALLLLRN